MPYYDYRSDDGETITKSHPLADAKPDEIVEDGIVYRRVYYPLGVIYNCLGFYTTDHGLSNLDKNQQAIEKWKRENLRGPGT